MNKAEELATIEQLHQKAEDLKAFVAATERDEKKSDALIAERFTTPNGATGVLLQFPATVADPSMTVMAYLIFEIVLRGGKVWRIEEAIKRWNGLRFPLRGVLCDVWKGDCAETYRALPAQARVGDLLGQSFVWFVDTNGEIKTHAGKSFVELMEEKVHVINPMGFAALVLSSPDIADPSTYPSFTSWRWEWIGAVTEEYAADAFSDGDGANLLWVDPGTSLGVSRARSALRGTPG